MRQSETEIEGSGRGETGAEFRRAEGSLATPRTSHDCCHTHQRGYIELARKPWMMTRAELRAHELVVPLGSFAIPAERLERAASHSLQHPDDGGLRIERFRAPSRSRRRGAFGVRLLMPPLAPAAGAVSPKRVLVRRDAGTAMG